MRAAFQALHVGGYRSELDVLICGVSENDDVALTFQRAASETTSDEIYVEYGPQTASGYGCVAQCLITRTHLVVHLNRPLSRGSGVTRFDVAIHVSDESYGELVHWLELVFSPFPDLLVVA